MSTSTAPVPASRAPQPVPAGPPVHTAPGPAQLLRQGLEGTPGRLRLAAAVSVLVCLAFALVGGYAFLSWGSALDDAKADAAQLVRVQAIQNDLVAADAAASNEYLSSGTTDAATRAAARRGDYDTALNDAAGLLAQAAGANAADAEKLTAVNAGIARYNGLIEQARANNRQQYQVGQAYLRQAGDVLRKEMVPALEAVAADNRQRVVAAYDSGNQATGLLTGAGILGLAGLLLTQLWLARRTHRILNVPLLTATAGVLVALVAGFSALSSVASSATKVGKTSYAATVSLAQARTAAFDAKSQESLGLIARGNSASAEGFVKADIDVTRAALQGANAAAGVDVTAPFDAWVTAHQAVRSAEDKDGDWAKARDLATGSSADGSNTLFTAFKKASGDALDVQKKAVADDLSSSRGVLVVLGWLTLVLGLIAAGAAYFGISQRLGEYR